MLRRCLTGLLYGGNELRCHTMKRGASLATTTLSTGAAVGMEMLVCAPLARAAVAHKSNVYRSARLQLATIGEALTYRYGMRDKTRAGRVTRRS